jgi:hypothetical protein
VSCTRDDLVPIGRGAVVVAVFDEFGPEFFYEAYWRRPEAYLDDHVRCGMSIWARVGPDAEQRAVCSLRDDLASGRWAERNRDLLDLDAAELGSRLLIA